VGYELRGIIAPARALRPLRAFVNGVVVDLGQGLGLVPMTPALFDEIRRGDEAGLRFAPARLFPPRLDLLLAAWSVDDPLAYVEADYFGGIGSQFAVAWHGGALVLGPLVLTEDEPWPAPGWSPISQALRHLGVSVGRHYDEFDAIGLGRHRSAQDWISAPPAPKV
jgi:hypothetical protein